MNLKPLITVFLLSFAGCCDSNSGGGGTGLKVERETREIEVIDHGDGTVTKKFPLHRTSYENLAFESRQRARDPFDIRKEAPNTAEVRPARKIFEDLSVEFPEGTSAGYDPESGILTFRHEPEWVDYAESILEATKSSIKTINVRLEIYEVPAALALRLEQSASEHVDHAPEWEALQKLVGDGEDSCSFVTSCNVRSQSGQRALYRDGSEHLAFAGFERDETDDSSKLRPRFDTRTVGTRFEVDLVLSPDDVTIDLHMSIEHHTAPPTMTPVAVPMPGEADPVQIEVPEYHAKKLTTQITMLNGETRLLCSWRVTGSPEIEERDVMRIVFLKTNVQELRFEHGAESF